MEGKRSEKVLGRSEEEEERGEEEERRGEERRGEGRREGIGFTPIPSGSQTLVLVEHHADPSRHVRGERQHKSSNETARGSREVGGRRRQWLTS